MLRIKFGKLSKLLTLSPNYSFAQRIYPPPLSFCIDINGNKQKLFHDKSTVKTNYKLVFITFYTTENRKVYFNFLPLITQTHNNSNNTNNSQS